MNTIEKILRNLADKDKLSHAYLFFGPKTAPKKELALSLARHLEGNEVFQDTLIFENAAIGINEVRTIRKFLYQTPIQSKKRVCIISDAENLTWQATPALLKIVEEPPPHSCVIMTAREKNVLSPALLSRFIKIYIPPARNIEISTYRDISKYRNNASEPSLAEEIEQSMIELYNKDKIKNSTKIAFLLRKLEMSRFNLNPKLQKKAIEYTLRK